MRRTGCVQQPSQVEESRHRDSNGKGTTDSQCPTIDEVLGIKTYDRSINFGCCHSFYEEYEVGGDRRLCRRQLVRSLSSKENFRVPYSNPGGLISFY